MHRERNGVIAVIILSSVLAGMSSSTKGEGRFSMKDCLQAYLEKRVAAPDFAIHYQIGNSFSGETEFRLRGDGRFELWSTVTGGRQPKAYSGLVGVERIEEVAKVLLDAEVWETQHLLDVPVPDDPEASIGIECAGQRVRVA